MLPTLFKAVTVRFHKLFSHTTEITKSIDQVQGKLKSVCCEFDAVYRPVLYVKYSGRVGETTGSPGALLGQFSARTR